MTALAAISALVTALCIGYHFGRRAGSTPLTWRKRTSRAALSKLAIRLLVLMTARRIRQSFLAERVLSDAGDVWAMKFVEPLQLLRGSCARLRLPSTGTPAVLMLHGLVSAHLAIVSAQPGLKRARENTQNDQTGRITVRH